MPPSAPAAPLGARMFRVNLRFLYSFAFAPGLGLVLGIFLPKRQVLLQTRFVRRVFLLHRLLYIIIGVNGVLKTRCAAVVLISGFLENNCVFSWSVWI